MWGDKLNWQSPHTFYNDRRLELLRLYVIDKEGINECREKHYQCNGPKNDRTIDIPQRTPPFGV